MASLETYEFLFVKPGDHVVIRNEEPLDNNQRLLDYWLSLIHI